MWPSPQGRRLEDSEPPCWTSGSRTGTPPPVAEEDCGTCGLPHPRTRGGFRLGQALHGPPRSAGLGGRRVLVSPRGTGAEPLSLGGPGGPAQPEALPERAVTPLSPFCRDTHLPLTPPKSHRDPGRGVRLALEGGQSEQPETEADGLLRGGRCPGRGRRSWGAQERAGGGRRSRPAGRSSGGRCGREAESGRDPGELAWPKGPFMGALGNRVTAAGDPTRRSAQRHASGASL